MSDPTDSDVVVTGRPTPQPARDPNQLTIIVAGGEVTGWEEIEVTLRAEGFPNDFHVAFSSPVPIDSAAAIVKAGDACQVLLGDDVVVTGYVDSDMPGGTPDTHRIEVIGRGKTQDLADCSGEWPGGAMTNVDARQVAEQLAAKYAIAVKMGDGASAGPKVDQLAVTYGETGAEMIQRFAHAASLLAYEDATGALVLAGVGATKAASGIVYGENVETWRVQNSVAGRYSDIVVLEQSQNPLIETGDVGNQAFTVTDPTMPAPRHRLLYQIMEFAAEHPEEFTKARADWDMSRRIGRSVVVEATVDSWRDKAGTLWSPNTLVPVDVPGLRIADKTLCISEVTFRRSNDSGTTASLVLMPPAAFAPEPQALVQVNTLGITPVEPAP